MRTKTLLLSAAALAGGLLTSQAQTVYSQNIVGYVNVPMAANSTYALVAPLIATNTSAETLFSTLNTGDQILTWNGSILNTYTFIAAGTWLDQNSNPTGAPNLAPGQGFFYQTLAGVAETNTFVGTVQLTNNVVMAANSTYFLGSTPPIVTNPSVETDTNFLSAILQTGDQVLTWNGSILNTYTYIGPGTWLDQNSNPTSAPTLSVGQGFYYQTLSGNAETWTQNLNIQ